MAEKLNLAIEGMHCGSCAIGIQMLASGLPGVSSAKVDYEGKKGEFEIDPSQITKEKLVASIAELGYKAS